MYDESVFFIGAKGASSTALLLFAPERVLSLHDARHETTFEEGRDYEVRQDERTVVRLPSSRMPCSAPEDVALLICADDDAFHRRQVEVTYTHAGGWDGPTPCGDDAVPGTIQRLRAAEPVRVALTGDSISEGYNASGFIRVPPYQAAYGALVAAGLEQAYGSPIELHNFAVAGWTSNHGLADVERVASVNPQLVIVAYGMNDASYAAPAELAGNVRALIDQVRRTSSDAEFVIVSPMLPNPEADPRVMPRFPAYRDALAQLSGRGVILADVTTLWTQLLARKAFYDVTGNGLNHPNDFGHRLYAQVILAQLVERDRLPTAADSGQLKADS
jgi:lysophospholipase L1-like esterase